MNKMKIFKTRNTCESNTETFARKNPQLGVRRIACGLLQYDGMYTLSNIPRKRNY